MTGFCEYVDESEGFMKARDVFRSWITLSFREKIMHNKLKL
jgi:hypothetical protein